MNSTEPANGALFNIVVVLLMGILWFAMLGHRDLIDPDEGRYAEIPREMVASGDWVTPRLNGFKYFEKPAFQYWMTAVSYTLFGQSNATARLWTAAFGFLCGLFVWRVGNAVFGKPAGFYAFVVTLSSLLFVGVGHLLTLDMSVSVFMVMAMGSFVVAQTRKAHPASALCWMLFSWASLAGAVLSKGLIGIVLPAGAMVVYSLWQRDWRLWFEIHLFKGIVVFLCITVPWFVMVSQENSEFLNFFFIHEHWERYTSTVHSREGPVYYFIPVFLLGMCPWLLTAVRTLLNPGFSWKASAGGKFDAERFLWVFCVLTLVFFSLGQSKMPAYILPVIPIIGLLVGKRLKLNPQLQADAYTTAVLAVLILLVGIFATQFASDQTPAELFTNCRPWLLASSAALFVSATVLFTARKHIQNHIAFAGLCALLSFQLLSWGFQEIAPSRSSRDIADAIHNNQLSNMTVYSVGSGYPESLPFYLNKTIVLSGYMGELEMGITAEPDKWLVSSQAFIERWNNEVQAVAVFKHKGFEKYQQLGLPMRVIYSGPRRVAVAKQ